MRRSKAEIQQAAKMGAAIRHARCCVRERLGVVASGELFAKLLGISKSTYYSLELGHGKPLTAAQFRTLLAEINRLDPEAARELRIALDKIYCVRNSGSSVLSEMLASRPGSAKQSLASNLIHNALSRGTELLKAGELLEALNVTETAYHTVEQSFPNHPDQVRLVLFNARVASATGAHYKARRMLQRWLERNKDFAPQKVICEVLLSETSCANRLELRSGPEAASRFSSVSKYIAARCSDSEARRDEDWNWVRNNSLRSAIISITDPIDNIDLDHLRLLFREFESVATIEKRPYGEFANQLVRARFFACTGKLDAAWNLVESQPGHETNLPDSPLHVKTTILLHMWSEEFEQARFLADKWANDLSAKSSPFAASQFFALRNVAETHL